MTFGQRFRMLRTELGLNQGDVCNRINRMFPSSKPIKRSSISMYENDLSLPEHHRMQDIADFFGVSLDFLLGNTDSREMQPDAEWDQDALELAQRLSKEGYGELNILFKKAGKLDRKEMDRLLKILKATLPENGDGEP
jgi:transcriptional regulator with XRE-family HTH domain